MKLTLVLAQVPVNYRAAVGTEQSIGTVGAQEAERRDLCIEAEEVLRRHSTLKVKDAGGWRVSAAYDLEVVRADPRHVYLISGVHFRKLSRDHLLVCLAGTERSERSEKSELYGNPTYSAWVVRLPF